MALRLPAEAWLAPPVVILAAMTAVGLMLRGARLRRFQAIAERTGLEVKAKIDPAHAELLFTAVTHLADATDSLTRDDTPEIIRSDWR